jgi:hypothetical protein
MRSRMMIVGWMCISLLWIPLAACAPAKPAPLTIGQLRNAEYRAEFLPEGKIELSDGLYARQSVLYRLDPMYALGDLNGDGIEEAAVVLTVEGERATSYLMVVSKEKGTPRHVASASLGGAAQIKSLAIYKGQITILLALARPGDSDCSCQPPETTQVYKLEGDKPLLVE